MRHLCCPFQGIKEPEMINHILFISNRDFTLISQMRQPFTLSPHSFSSRPDLQVSKPSLPPSVADHRHRERVSECIFTQCLFNAHLSGKRGRSEEEVNLALGANESALRRTPPPVRSSRTFLVLGRPLGRAPKRRLCFHKDTAVAAASADSSSGNRGEAAHK